MFHQIIWGSRALATYSGQFFHLLDLWLC